MSKIVTTFFLIALLSLHLFCFAEPFPDYTNALRDFEKALDPLPHRPYAPEEEGPFFYALDRWYEECYERAHSEKNGEVKQLKLGICCKKYRRASGLPCPE